MSLAQNIAIKRMKTYIFEKALGYQLHRLYAAKARSWPDQHTVKGWVSTMSRCYRLSCRKAITWSEVINNLVCP